MDNGINLLRTNSQLSQSDLALLSKVKIFTTGFTVVFLAVGLFIGMAFLAARFQHTQLESKKTQLNTALNAQATKQVLLVGLQERLPAIREAKNMQYPWNDIISDLSRMAEPPYLQSLTVAEDNTITISARTESLEDIKTMVNNALDLEKEKKIKSSKIVSFGIMENSEMEIIFSYTPVLVL